MSVDEYTRQILLLNTSVLTDFPAKIKQCSLFTGSELSSISLKKKRALNLGEIPSSSLSLMAMSLPSGFQERLQQMEETRNQRLSLLQAEKELQDKKSMLLYAKLSNIRFMEQRCLLLEQKDASLRFKISIYKSEIDKLESTYQTAAQQFRDLKSELDELEECEKEKDKFYETKSFEMNDFRRKVEKYVVESRLQVEEMRRKVGELTSNLEEFQANNGNNSEIAAAEARKAELLQIKENLDRSLASKKRLKAQLQKQFYNILISQDQQRKKN